MTSNVIFRKVVRRQIGECGFSRAAVVRLYTNVRIVLSTQGSRYRHNRWRGRPDCFNYPYVVVDGETWHRCNFVVEDRAAPGDLRIIWLFHEARPRKT